MTYRIFLVSLFLSFFPLVSCATIFTLYDETQANLPDDQAWLTYFANSNTTSSSVISNGVNLQTDTASSAGFSNYPVIPFAPKNPLFPALDSNSGFSLSFSMQLNNETHSSTNRAGFSLILLDMNHNGVELGFWQDSIWSQSSQPLFQAKNEQIPFDTMSNLLIYDLTFLNNDYFLTQNNTLLLSGELNDYSAFNGGPFGSSLPYSLSNYLFLGDDTSSASADVNLGRITLSDSALFTIPSPSPIALLYWGLLYLWFWRTG